MINIESIAGQVLKNCEISDSRHAGTYSVCGLALRLRELYKWEKGLEPWMEEDSGVLLEWISSKEDRWEQIRDNNYGPIEIEGRDFDPFDVKGINQMIQGYGLFYGAGYAHSMKPSFLLASISDRKAIMGYEVIILGKEFARDLLSIPAFTQERKIIIRKEASRNILWDQIMFSIKSGKWALDRALKHYGINDEIDRGKLKEMFKNILMDQIEFYIHHEIGEMEDRDFHPDVWRSIIGRYPHSPVELISRAVKDILADTTKNGSLNYLINNRLKGPLYLYGATLDGLRKAIFPEILKAIRSFEEKEDWDIIEDAVKSGFSRVKALAHQISSIYKTYGEKEPDRFEKKLREEILIPLGIK